MVTCSLSFSLPLKVLTTAPLTHSVSVLLDALTGRGYRVEHLRWAASSQRGVASSAGASSGGTRSGGTRSGGTRSGGTRSEGTDAEGTGADIASLEASQPDLLLIDLQTTGSHGYELCRQVRQRPALQDVAVFIIGNAPSRVQSILALRSGANDYLSEPLQIEECLLRLEQQLQASQCVRALRSQNAGMAYQLQHQTRQLQHYASLQTALAQKNRQLEQLAYLDGLTGVANRLSFMQKLDEMWAMMGRTQQPLSLILCDVDHFKGYNDTYGHVEGDRCLQMIGEVLTSVARRRSDWVARYGGEEFVVLLPATDADGAKQVAQQIQQQLAQRRCPHSANTASPYVSMSIGVSSLYPRSTLSTDVLIRLADEALYAAKLQGRNRVLTANSAYLQQPETLPHPQAEPQPIDVSSESAGAAMVMHPTHAHHAPTLDNDVLRVGS